GLRGGEIIPIKPGNFQPRNPTSLYGLRGGEIIPIEAGQFQPQNPTTIKGLQVNTIDKWKTSWRPRKTRLWIIPRTRHCPKLSWFEAIRVGNNRMRQIS
ncbi:MAG TPA: hypothetical protein VIH16_09010, partial [Bellilinea sp.]